MKQTPALSVVIPAHNEALNLPATLRALHVQVECPDFEIIVVDNASSDATASVARRLGAVVVQEKKLGVANARQAGFLAARAPIIATTDADTIVPTHWLSTIAKMFAQHPEAVGLAGPILYDFKDPIIQKVTSDIASLVFPMNQRLHRGNPYFFGANFAVRAEAFRAIRGFSPDLLVGEDTDLAHRLGKIGPILFVPTIHVLTSSRRLKKEGVQAVWRYIRTYLRITRPAETISDRVRLHIEHYRQQFLAQLNLSHSTTPRLTRFKATTSEEVSVHLGGGTEETHKSYTHQTGTKIKND